MSERANEQARRGWTNRGAQVQNSSGACWTRLGTASYITERLGPRALAECTPRSALMALKMALMVSAVLLLLTGILGCGGDVEDGVVLRVSGAEGIAYTGSYSVGNTLETFSGTLDDEPTDYKLPAPEERENLDLVFDVIDKQAGAGELTGEIYVDGEVVASDTSDFIVEVSYNPQE